MGSGRPGGRSIAFRFWPPIVEWTHHDILPRLDVSIMFRMSVDRPTAGCFDVDIPLPVRRRAEILSTQVGTYRTTEQIHGPLRTSEIPSTASHSRT